MYSLPFQSMREQFHIPGPEFRWRNPSDAENTTETHPAPRLKADAEGLEISSDRKLAYEGILLSSRRLSLRAEKWSMQVHERSCFKIQKLTLACHSVLECVARKL